MTPRKGDVRSPDTADTYALMVKGQSTTYRLFDDHGDDLGLLDQTSPRVDRGDVIKLDDGSVALVIRRIDVPLRTPRRTGSALLHVARFGKLG